MGSKEISFGLMVPTLFVAESCDLNRIREAAELADESGVDVLWVGDHLLYNVPLLDPIITLGVLASQTKRVQIGTNVLQLPLRNPLTVAKEFATLSYLTGGRVVMGVGVGGEYEPEWVGAGVNLRERGQRCDEALRMLHHHWDGNGAAGVFYDAPGVSVEPRPARPIPIWIGGRSDAAYARASNHDGYIGYMLSVRRFADARNEILNRGADPNRFTFGLQLMTRIEDTQEQAVETACGALAKVYGVNPKAFRRYIAAGTPEQVVEFVQSYVDEGLTHASFYLHGPDWSHQATRLVSEVLPLLSAAEPSTS